MKAVSKAFSFGGLPTRIIFGAGTSTRLGDELKRLDIRRVLIISTAQQEGQARLIASGIDAAAFFPHAVMHTPVTVTEQAMTVVKAGDIDGLVAIGGGSTTGLSKAIALRTGLPQVILPTTYAGSEVTPILGQTEGGIKTTVTDERVRPEVVIYDVDLTLTLPAALSGVSGINAIAHAVEALYARDANPIVDLMAAEGIRALAASLPAVVASPHDREARANALYGAWLCGACLGSVGMALHHKLCHTLGGSFDLPHAETHAIVLPHALAYNASAIPAVMDRLCDILGSADPAGKLFTVGREVGAPHGLRELGMPEAGIEKAVDLACSNPYWNPRAIERAGIATLIRRAWAGEEPEAI